MELAHTDSLDARRLARALGWFSIGLGVLGMATLGTQRTRRRPVVAAGAIRVRKSIAINRPAAELYEYWRNLDNLPRLISHLEQVRALDDRRSHWIARGERGRCAEWDAEITAQPANHRISWRSVDGSEMPTEGSVQFEALSAGRGTLVRIDLQYRPAGGPADAALAALFGESPERLIGEDLRRFKQRMETGEIATTEGQPHGQRGPISRALP